MARKWRAIRIFISSTFRDMHTERNHLVRFVFPELKEKCRKKHVHLIDVDLRWGVTEADVQDGKALDICLDEIDTCRPYFLGLLGHCYGSIPSGETYSITAQEIFHGVLHNDIPKQVVDLRRIIEGKLEGKMLTNKQINCLVRCYRWNTDKSKYLLSVDATDDELEIIRSVFEKYSVYQRDRSFFFFRSESLTRKLAGKKSDELADRERVNQHKLDELKEKIKDGFIEKEKVNQHKLDELKQDIIDAKLPYFKYDDIEAFGEKVKEVLWEHIEAELGEPLEEEKDWLEEEAEFHDLFIEDRTRRFVGRRKLLDRMNDFCGQNCEPSVMVITGEPGCGKSALMGRFSEEIVRKHPDWLIIPHFVGASPDSTSLRQTLKRLCTYLKKQLDKKDEVPEDIKELKQIFPDWLAKAAKQRRILIILDAVNQLEKTDNAHAMQWLPLKLPENVRYVISTLAGEAHDALMLRRDKPEEVMVAGLDKQEIKKLVHDYLKEIRKDFPNKDAERTFYEKIKLGNPLYILVALEELRVFGDFYELPKKIKRLPDNVPELFGQVLERIEYDFSKPLLKDCTALIACGRQGMTAEELQALLAAYAPQHDDMIPAYRLPDMTWARLYRTFSSYLFERSGVIDFFHGQLKEAVKKRYLREEVDRNATHKIIADYFEKRWSEPYTRALDELPYQLFKASDLEGLKKVLFNFRFIEAKCEVGMIYELLHDYDEALQALPSDDSQRRSLELLKGGLKLSSLVVAKSPNLLAGQLIGRMDDLSDPEIKKTLETAKAWRGGPWLRPLHASLHPPGTALLLTLKGHSDWWVTTVAITPDGLRAVSGSKDDTLKVWDLETGQELKTLEGHSGGVNTVAITPDGLRAVSGSWDDTLKVWDLETGQELKTLEGHSQGVNTLAITPDGLRAVSGSWDNTLKVWDLETGKELKTLQGHSNIVTTVAITPDGLRAVSGSEDDTLKVWDLEKGKELKTLKGPSSGVYTLAITPDGLRAVSGSKDDTLKVWDLETGQELKTLEGHSGGVSTVAITPDGLRAVSGSWDDTLKVWDLETGQELKTLEGHSGGVSTVAITPDGLRAVSGSWDNTLKVWDLETGKVMERLGGGGIFIRALAITPDGLRAVLGYKDHTLKVWDLEKGKELKTLQGHSNIVTTVAITPDGLRAVLGYKDHTLKVWDLEKGKELKTLKGPSSGVYTLAITPDGLRAVLGCEDDTFKVWDLEKGKELKTLQGHSDSVYTLAITPDGLRAVLGYEDHTLEVWDLKTGKVMERLGGGGIFIRALAITPDGLRAVSGCEDHTLKVWDLEKGKELKTLKGPSSGVITLAITPDGLRAVLGCEDHTLKVWDLEKGKELKTLEGHSGGVNTVAITPDGLRAVSGSRDHTLKVWDLEKGQVIAFFMGESDIESTAVAPDVRTTVAGSKSGRVHILRLEEVD